MLDDLGRPTGLCRSCRYVEARLARYTCAPWAVAFECQLRAVPMAPHAGSCLKYEREPGADDEARSG
jgi:hypothetical protein